ncbi:hypothetical protein CR513_43474, partial [Mucuna pruriens]
MQAGQLVNIVSQMQLADSRSIPSQTIPNPNGGGVNTPSLRSAETETETELVAYSRVQQPAKSAPLPFPNRTVVGKRSEIDENLLKLFRKVDINILLLDAIKQIPKYAKFLK